MKKSANLAVIAVAVVAICVAAVAGVLVFKANNGPAVEPDSTYESTEYAYAPVEPSTEPSTFQAIVDLTTQVPEGAVANTAFNYVLDNKQIGAGEFYYDFDIRREMLVEKNVEPSLGRLTTLQKMWLGVELDANETFVVGDNTFYAPYSEAGEFAGLKINDKLYKVGETFTATAAGVYTIDYAYGKQAEETTAAPETEAPTTEAPTTEAPVTEAPTTDAPATEAPTTDAPATEAPTTNAPTTEAPKTDDGGCGGFVALGIVACLIPAAIVVLKKRD